MKLKFPSFITKYFAQDGEVHTPNEDGHAVVDDSLLGKIEQMLMAGFTKVEEEVSSLFDSPVESVAPAATETAAEPVAQTEPNAPNPEPPAAPAAELAAQIAPADPASPQPV